MKYFAYRYNRIFMLLLLNGLLLALVVAPLFALAAGNGADPTPAKDADIFSQFLSWFGRLIGNIVLSIAAMFTYVGGLLLDTAVSELVLGMGEHIRSSNGGSLERSINQAWTVIRDISNIAFIFGFVYIGIRTIFDYDSSFTKRFLGSLVIGALLINFSLFFTKVVIDASNILAVEIYETLIEPSYNVAAGQTGGIAATVANQMGITSWYKVPDANTFSSLTDGGQFTFYIAGAIFLMIAGFVFGAGGLLLVVRFVALILIMIFSPILFAAAVFPQTAGQAKKLWGLLINYSFFAPIYLFLIYISLLMMAATQTIINPTNQGFAAAVTSNETVKAGSIESFGVILNFIIISVFMIAALTIARSLGIAGGAQAIKIGGNLRRGAVRQTTRFAGASTAGLAARTGRSVVGSRAYNKLQDKDWKEKKNKSWVGRQQIKLANAAQNASFDARQIGGVGKKNDLGEGKKGGYAGGIAAAQKKEDAYAKLLGQVPDDDIRVKAREQEVKDFEKQIREAQASRSAEKDAEVLDASGKLIGGKKFYANQIAELEEKRDKAKDKVEQEKNRMILGSSYESKNVTPAMAHADVLIKREEDKIKKLVTDYVNATTDADRTRIENDAKAAKEIVDKLHQGKLDYRREQGDDTGYADVVQQRGWATSLATGRTRGVNRTVGKELRKKHSKRQQRRREPRERDNNGGGGGGPAGGPTGGPTPSTP